MKRLPIDPGSEFERCRPLPRALFGDVRPVATTIPTGLAEPSMCIGIETPGVRGG